MLPLLLSPFCCERLLPLLHNYLFASVTKNKTHQVYDAMPASQIVCVIQEYDQNISLFYDAFIDFIFKFKISVLLHSNNSKEKLSNVD